MIGDFIEKIPWDYLEEELSGFCHKSMGRPAKPIRLMVGLMIFKQMENLSDERIVEAWVANPYMQYFYGETQFQWHYPCDPTDLTYFRKRIGEEGVQKILEVSILLHGKKALEKEVLIDTTVQEKNITFPTDSKLHRKIIENCRKIAQDESIPLRRSYNRTVKRLLLDLRFANHPKNRKRANKAQRHPKTIAGRLVRELFRKLPEYILGFYRATPERFKAVPSQQKKSKNKIYSLHEPDVYCISKGNEHKKYEFGSKASIVSTRDSGIIVGAMCFKANIYDGHTLERVLRQVTNLLGERPDVACVTGNIGGERE